MDEVESFRQGLFRRVSAWANPRNVSFEWIRLRDVDSTGEVTIELGRGDNHVTGFVRIDAQTGVIRERC